MPVPNSSLLGKCFENMIKQSIGSLSINLRFKCLDAHLSLAIPDHQHIDHLVVSYCLPCLAKVDISILTDILVFSLFEEFVLIFSSNAALLSQLILLLLTALRPLKYPFSVVFNLPASMKYLLESPFPTIIGTTIPEEMLREETSLADSTRASVYFNLDTQQVRRRPEYPEVTDYANRLRGSLTRAKQKQDIDVYRRVRQAIIH
jgi:hypothetical protein